jgi:GNAT superfamily N-acetyltransferase
MTTRQATEADIPKIVALLKISLGELRMPKSEAFWRWKHIENPFGSSPVLLAEADGQLVGVRAFMRWEWQQSDKVIKAVRAVDTATHPDHQGKGIFKKLTRQLVEQCRDEDVHFIFNTPNVSSMPGYLKMGWQKYGRMNIRAFPVIPGFRKASSTPSIYQGESKVDAQRFIHSGTLVTNQSNQFLKWRYGRNPNDRYFKWQAGGNRIIYRIKSGSRFTEMRIVEGFYTGQYGGEMFKLLQQEARWHGAHFITWTGFKLPFPNVPLPVGPLITLNYLNHSLPQPLKNWQPTMGDMEVF